VRAVQEAPRSGFIDGLRGVSVLLVVGHHISLRIPLQKTLLSKFISKRLIAALVYNGYEAVFVFFVISGFLITSAALRRYGGLERVDVRSFYVRRLARIGPCLFLLVLVLSGLHWIGARDYRNQSVSGVLSVALLAR